MVTPAQLRAIRAMLNVSQQEFADTIDLARSTYVSYEKGLKISQKSLDKIINYATSQNLTFYEGGVIMNKVNQ